MESKVATSCRACGHIMEIVYADGKEGAPNESNLVYCDECRTWSIFIKIDDKLQLRPLSEKQKLMITQRMPEVWSMMLRQEKEIIQMKKNIVTVAVEYHWLPPYRLEYDGKHIALFGRDKRFPIYSYPLISDLQFAIDWKDAIEVATYDERLLIPVVLERRDIKPRIINYNEFEIKISLY